MIRLSWIIFILTLGLLAGCSGNQKKTPTQKEQATASWNAARASVLASLAKDQFESGNADKARQTCDEALKLNSKSAPILVLSGRMWIERGQLELADKDLQRARELDPKNAEADYFSAVVYQRWQQPGKAYELYLVAMNKMPSEPAFVLAASEMLVQLNRLDEAVALLAEKSTKFQNNAVLLDAWGQLLQQQGRNEEALAAFRRASMLGTDDASIREHLALCLVECKQYKEASEVLARLLKLEQYKTRSDLLAALGECQLQMNQPRDARQSFEAATQIDSSSAGLWLGLAKAALQTNDLARAEASARKAVMLEASLADAHLVVGYARLKQNRLNDALQAFQRASALNAQDTVSLCMIGYVLEKSGKHDKAMGYYARALQLKPNDPLANELMAGASD